MKKHLFIFIALASGFLGAAQNIKDTSLNKRLEVYMRLNREAKFEELMNFVHPSLFSLAPRNQMLELFRKAYDNDMMHLSIDSTAVINISGDFRDSNAIYRKIEYWMRVTVTFKDSDTVNDPDFITKTSDLLKIGFPNSRIVYNKTNRSFVIGTANFLIAIKDNEISPWMFLGYQKNEAFLRKLFPASVISHFQLL